MDNLLEALNTGRAFGARRGGQNENRKRTPRAAGGKCLKLHTTVHSPFSPMINPQNPILTWFVVVWNEDDRTGYEWRGKSWWFSYCAFCILKIFDAVTKGCDLDLNGFLSHCFIFHCLHIILLILYLLLAVCFYCLIIPQLFRPPLAFKFTCCVDIFTNLQNKMIVIVVLACTWQLQCPLPILCD